MSWFQSFYVATWAWRAAVASFFRPVLWLPFLLVAGVQTLLILLLVLFHHPVLVLFGLPLIKLLGGEVATHYPTLYYALPTMFYRANIAIDALIVSVAGGAATLLFAQAFGFDRGQPAWRQALRHAPALIAVNLLNILILLGIGVLNNRIPAYLVLRSAPVRWGSRGGVLILFILVQCLVAYASAWIVLMGRGLWPAIRDSVRVTNRTFLPTLLVVGIPALLMWPFSYASGRTDIVAAKFKPEIIVGLLGSEVVCQALVTFFLVGAVTRLFLWGASRNPVMMGFEAGFGC